MTQRLAHESDPGYFARLFAVVSGGLAALVRSPSHSRRAEARRHWAKRSLSLAVISSVVIVAFMFMLDVAEIRLMPPRGTASLWPVRIATDFGKSSYVLWLLAGLLVLAVLLSARVRNRSRAVMASVTTRVAYLFLAVLFSDAVCEIMKGIVGRGRPFVGGEPNAFNFSLFAWNERYASFPSGHATTSCALAFAISALWPQARIAMVIYVIAIAMSRLVLLAHHPSDIVAGALVGVIGAMTVRYWFAARGLAFVIRPDGSIDPLAGPSAFHLKKVARDAAAT